MNKIFLFWFIFILSVGLVLALSNDEGTSIDFKYETPVNYSTIATVNSSDYWDSLDTPMDIEQMDDVNFSSIETITLDTQEINKYGDDNVIFFQNVTTGENPFIRLYGWANEETSKKYGQFQIDSETGALTITAETSGISFGDNAVQTSNSFNAENFYSIDDAQITDNLYVGNTVTVGDQILLNETVPNIQVGTPVGALKIREGLLMDSNAFFSFSTSINPYTSGYTNWINNFNNYVALGIRRTGSGIGSFIKGMNSGGTQQFQINGTGVLVGNGLYFGDNDIIYLGNSRDSHIYWDGTNLIFDYNTTNPNALAWFSGNISAVDYDTRTSIYDKTRGNALDFIRDADEYKIGLTDEINHSAFYGYKTYEVKDINNCWNVTEFYCWNVTETWHEFNETTNRTELKSSTWSECEEELPPEIKDYWEIYTEECGIKLEEGVSLNDEIDVLRQAIYELKLENEALRDRVEALETGGVRP